VGKERGKKENKSSSAAPIARREVLGNLHYNGKRNGSNFKLNPLIFTPLEPMPEGFIGGTGGGKKEKGEEKKSFYLFL